MPTLTESRKCLRVAPEERPARLEPAEAAGVREPAASELVPVGERALDRSGDRLRALRIDADGGVAGRLVERRVRRGDDGDARRHRLDDRHPEALEPGWVDEGGRAAI